MLTPIPGEFTTEDHHGLRVAFDDHVSVGCLAVR
jgi:hypothetical protein